MLIGGSWGLKTTIKYVFYKAGQFVSLFRILLSKFFTVNGYFLNVKSDKNHIKNKKLQI